MKETSLQTLVVDAIRANNGFAFKLANRFLIGVPDVLAQPRNMRTSLWEVKKNPEPWAGSRVRLALTPHQYSFLDRFTDAGGICGVISFLVGRNHLFCGVFDMFQVHKGVYSNERYYTELKRGLRGEMVYEMLMKEYEKYDRHDEIAGEPWTDTREL